MKDLKQNTGALIFWLLYFAFISLSACSLFLTQRGQQKISLPPSMIETVSGYFSFQLEKENSIYKGKAWLCLAPTKGRLEIRDPLGRLISIFLWSDYHEWLILPTEKAYWSGAHRRSEIMAEIFDFPIEPIELVAWIIRDGQSLKPLADSKSLAWAMKGQEKESWSHQLLEENKDEWLVEWDEEGKLKRGRKGNLKIEVQDLAKNKKVARLLNFSHPQLRGRLAVLKLDFNQPFSSHMFEAEKVIPLDFQALTWEQIKSRLRIE